ncbi:MAG TPA: GDSL-type esterase/lipase family protein [Tepidisphaeraceae bacterium]|nr:GDSL-type esterase/lipase family protein [Tepidisphaeraceae bacterium]
MRIAFGIALVICAINVAVFASGGKPNIFICGDSTSKFSGSETPTSMQSCDGKQRAGWGTPIAEFFDPARVTVRNVGQPGRSSMTYYNGDWPKVLPQINSGDFLLLVFGINDGGRGTPPGIGDEVRPGANGEEAHTYGWYMARMANDAREKGAHPYFLTVTTRNIWTNPKAQFRDATPTAALPSDYDPKQDKIERGTGDGRYTQWQKDIGAKIHVPVFDLTNYCADVYEKLGREETNKFYSDHNHTYLEGARVVARSIVAGLKAFKNSPFTALLSEQGKAVEPANAKYISDNLSESATAK